MSDKGATRNADRGQARYAIYARTATGGLETLEAQVDEARALVRDVPVMVYRDMDVSGLTTERPALSALLNDMEAGKLDEVPAAA